MKKIMLLLFVAALLLLPGATATITPIQTTIQPNTSTQTDMTHTVFTEYVTTTKCPYCVTASAQLNSIYESHDYDYYFVTMVADQNNKVYPRVKSLGTEGVPDVHFDGGYRNLVGQQNDEQPYRMAITSSGGRDVLDVDMQVEVSMKAGGTLSMTITVTNNEAEKVDSHIRVYIVEPTSRWNDIQGNPYHFGALDIPVDRALAMPQADIQSLGDTTVIKRTWMGSLWNFGDISEDNIMVIAALFDPDTGYVIESAAGQPAGLEDETPQQPLINFLYNLRLLFERFHNRQRLFDF